MAALPPPTIPPDPEEAMHAPAGEPLVISERADALVVARVLAYWHPRCLTLVVLDEDRAVIDAIPIADTIDIEEVAEIVVGLGEISQVAEVLYVSADPPSGEVLSEDDVCRWHRVRRMHDDSGLRVFDWLLVTGNTVRSMAETTGSW